MSLNDKIKLVISMHHLTPSHFADEIGVQRSSISHILSGRNRPSLEIVQKIVSRFPDITYEWLLEENENVSHASVVGSSHTNSVLNNELRRVQHKSPIISEVEASKLSMPIAKSEIETHQKERIIHKILVFYNDNTFIEYSPSSSP